ncbi:MAG: alpha/beta hydrolase [Rhodospirillaceae bacterium]|jgi:poly(3-hydroxybutyrate) depolymerase|nr:alpha/beta hydrolase [Rhodospirillaceae bacterium]MBT5049612.1 alpha/beta hydrolase [Rhodospirillaceae bacterium]MBT5455939.1 alpha/beta hydrolase [Rhodospirillaceae bacterium]
MRLDRVSTVLVAMVVQSTLPAPALSEPVIGAGAFHMDDGRGQLAASMRVFYFRPDSFKPDGPIVIVIHGMGRTAARYRDYWEEASDRYGALVLVPEFTRENYRGSRQFNMGNLFNRDGSATPRSEWSFPVIDRVFHAAKKRFAASRSKFHLFGHSAGAQFVHRMVLFAPTPHMGRAIAANAGWYTLPIQMERFPYGLGETSLSVAGLKKAFARRLTIMLGTDDNDPNHRSLRRTDEAMRQGPHRLARGHYFFKSATDVAQRLGTTFAWDLRDIPGVSHRGSRMTSAAARYLFGGP